LIDTRLASGIWRRERPFAKPGSVILPIATACLALTTFIVDTVTDYEIAAATFYVVIVLLTLGFCRKRGLSPTVVEFGLRSRIPGLASILRLLIVCSMRSIRQRPKVWESASRFVARSWRGMADAFWQ
jgi:hypothetical protein